MFQRSVSLGNDDAAVPQSDVERRLDRRMDRLYAIVTSPHSADVVRLDALARELGLSPSHLSRRFKEASGISFRTLAVRSRQLRAAELLRTTGLSVKEIAAQSGYRHVSDFSACFRRIHGVSPTEYRESLNQGVQGEAIVDGPRK